MSGLPEKLYFSPSPEHLPTSPSLPHSHTSHLLLQRWRPKPQRDLLDNSYSGTSSSRKNTRDFGFHWQSWAEKWGGTAPRATGETHPEGKVCLKRQLRPLFISTLPLSGQCRPQKGNSLRVLRVCFSAYAPKSSPNPIFTKSRDSLSRNKPIFLHWSVTNTLWAIEYPLRRSAEVREIHTYVT